jgi:hypothetical protein
MPIPQIDFISTPMLKNHGFDEISHFTDHANYKILLLM